MKIRNLLAALVVALLSVSTARALSTIDPTQPAQGSQLSSAVIRNNFAAAYRDATRGRKLSADEIRDLARGVGDEVSFQRGDERAYSASEVFALLNAALCLHERSEARSQRVRP